MRAMIWEVGRKVPPDLRIFPDQAALAAAAAAEVASRLAAAAANGTATLVLAGGSTPRALYACLAAAHGAQVPWQRVDVFWGDERAVPLDDARSNYRMAREALLDALPIPPARIHPIDACAGGAPDAEYAAVAYEHELRAHFPPPARQPAFDLVLLGMGEDGHTASLFPGAPTLSQRTRWVLPAQAPPGVESHERVTLTLPALTAARAIFVVVAGAAKAAPLRRALAEAPSPACPASLLRTGSAPVTWWLDQAAAGELAGGR